ncbi:orc1/cdc6 family replication initiation protein (plasmid) [Halobiforma lacisalsi AJ5]|uniref:Orc1/cdc6 family replication initiation protein n=1 Tax=Natronobacterium lacisalsi AJ5 TaxID=358396 RepID=M0LV68_NATLA|nr:Cdc6/Cdc18 family protein [Halobiforma lacisalsi]APX00211.1 orc1/cdc6 family replication initiation protein [Halobiforma lacisalsi AJ5]EMA37371.1 orc1/cdc6 family replication initiation protein [Halobiforma lacisalsi AJ5]
MISDYEVLQPDVQPDREVVVHRDTEIDYLTGVLEPLTHGVAPGGAFLSGPPGVGKTLVTQLAVDDLEEEAGVATAWVNCFSTHSRRTVLKRILATFENRTTLEYRSVATDDFVPQIRAAIDKPTVLVLDEADQLDDMQVVQELYGTSDLTLILISNEPWAECGAENPQLNSRMTSLQEICFESYTDAQLVSILEQRRQVGVKRGVVNDAVLEYIARESDSDARQAIALLYHTVRNAQLNNRDVTPTLVDRSKGDARSHVTRSRLSALSREQRLALEVLAESGPVTSGTLYDAYEGASDDPVTDRALRDWLSKFEKYELVTNTGPEHVPKYEVREIVLEELGISA